MPELTTTAYLAIAAVAAFVAVTLLVTTVTARVSDRRALYRSLRQVRAIDLGAQGIRKRELAESTLRRLVVPFLNRLTEIGRRVTPAGVTERLDRELGYAGRPFGLDAERILLLKALLPLMLGGSGFGMTALLGWEMWRGIIVLAFFGFIGYYIPEWFVRSRASARQSAIQVALPDSLDLLSITVEAGLGFDAALARVAKEVGGPLGEELHRVVQGVQLGENRIDAMRGLADRNDVPELKSFVLAMVQAQILGISVGTVLKVQAGEIRLKRRQRAEEKAQKLPVKILFPLIFFMFPALFVALMGPAAIIIMDEVLTAF